MRGPPADFFVPSASAESRGRGGRLAATTAPRRSLRPGRGRAVEGLDEAQGGRHVDVQQYDRIGEAFEGFKSLPLIRYGEVPSFLAMVGDVSGRSVLDLACGTGFYSREFKR